MLFPQAHTHTLSTDLRDKPEVVRHQYHATIKVVDGISQSIDGLNVQVIGWFVQKQQVGALPCQPCKCHSATLAVRQVAYRADLMDKKKAPT